jgi:hypothetical protein
MPVGRHGDGKVTCGVKIGRRSSTQFVLMLSQIVRGDGAQVCRATDGSDKSIATVDSCDATAVAPIAESRAFLKSSKARLHPSRIGNAAPRDVHSSLPNVAAVHS